jgi:hypothetical protein
MGTGLAAPSCPAVAAFERRRKLLSEEGTAGAPSGEASRKGRKGREGLRPGEKGRWLLPRIKQDYADGTQGAGLQKETKVTQVRGRTGWNQMGD